VNTSLKTPLPGLPPVRANYPPERRAGERPLLSRCRPQFRGENLVVGRFLRQVANGSQPDIHGRGRQTLPFEVSAVFLDERFPERAAVKKTVPVKKLIERKTVSPARVHRGNGIDHQFP